MDVGPSVCDPSTGHDLQAADIDTSLSPRNYAEVKLTIINHCVFTDRVNIVSIPRYYVSSFCVPLFSICLIQTYYNNNYYYY